MAYFAKLDENNIVITVHTVENNEILVDGVENEQKGIDFLNTLHKLNATWKQTSYNTDSGVHSLGGTPLRKNYAGVGYQYDPARDAFIAPKNFPSWVLNETTCRWDAPLTYPDPAKNYVWNEEAHQADNTQGWDLVTPVVI